MKENKIEDMKKEYMEMNIPMEIQDSIAMGIERGRKEMTHNNWKQSYWTKSVAGFVIASVILTTAVNVSPSFAANLEKLPIIGKIVQVLQFTDKSASGGVITDGSDISDIEVVVNEGHEEVRIEFSNEAVDQTNVGAFNVIEGEYPSTLTFEIGGARKFTALEDFSVLKESAYVKDIYPIITLDDSLIRFVVEFYGTVETTVVELETPPGIVVQIAEGAKNDNQSVFSVRTASYERSETFAIMESTLSENYETRVLKDDEGLYFVELGVFDSLEAAEIFIQDASKGIEEVLNIEEVN